MTHCVCLGVCESIMDAYVCVYECDSVLFYVYNTHEFHYMFVYETHPRVTHSIACCIFSGD